MWWLAVYYRSDCECHVFNAFCRTRISRIYVVTWWILKALDFFKNCIATTLWNFLFEIQTLLQKFCFEINLLAIWYQQNRECFPEKHTICQVALFYSCSYRKMSGCSSKLSKRLLAEEGRDDTSAYKFIYLNCIFLCIFSNQGTLFWWDCVVCSVGELLGCL